VRLSSAEDKISCVCACQGGFLDNKPGLYLPIAGPIVAVSKRQGLCYIVMVEKLVWSITWLSLGCCLAAHVVREALHDRPLLFLSTLAPALITCTKCQMRKLCSVFFCRGWMVLQFSCSFLRVWFQKPKIQYFAAFLALYMCTGKELLKP